MINTSLTNKICNVMALKIDKKEGSLGSLDEMRIQVMFKNTNGLEISSSAASSSVAESMWVADSVGDLPCVGDHIMLPNAGKNDDTAVTKNSYKVTARYIDYDAFIRNGERIVCTIKLESGEGL